MACKSLPMSAQTAAEQLERLVDRLQSLVKRQSVSLKLRESTETEMEGEQFQSIVDKLKRLSPALTELNLSGKHLGDRIINVIARALEAVPFPYLKTIDLSRNSFGTSGVQALARVLESGHVPALKKLSLRYYEIGGEGANLLWSALQGDHLRSLEALDMRGTSIRDAGVAALAEAFQGDHLPALTSLDLGSCQFGVAGAKALALAIQGGHLRALETLNLWRNLIADAGMTALAEGIQSRHLSALTKLDSSYCNFTGTGARALARAIEGGHLPSLEIMDLQGNHLGSSGFVALAGAFESGELTSLKVLKLGYESGDLIDGVADERSLVELATALKRRPLPNLDLLDLKGIGCSKNFAEAMRDAFHFNKTLVAEIAINWSPFTRLQSSAEGFRKKNQKFTAMLKELREEEEVPANHGKIFLCGYEKQGKTTLSKTLRRELPPGLSLFIRERKSVTVVPTRGIQISHIVDKDANGEAPLTVAVWDLAGQHEFYTLHNAFLPDLAFADGKATTFLIVCDANYNHSPRGELHREQALNYWMRFIASSSRRGIEDGKRQVLLVLNRFNNARCEKEYWKKDLNMLRENFHDYLDIHPEPFIVDARVQSSVKGLKTHLLNHTTKRLKDKRIPEICRTIGHAIADDVKKNLPVIITLSNFLGRYQYSSIDKVKAVLEYLHESGDLIYFREGSLTEGVDPQRSLVVLDPDFICQRVVGHLLLPDRMLNPLKHETAITRNMGGDGSIHLKHMIQHLQHLSLSPNDMQDIVDDIVAILLRLGLCYRVGQDKVLIPALVERVEIPIEWRSPQMITNQWVMGFCLKVLHGETTLLPMSVFRRLQVELAQDRMCSNFSDSDYAVGKLHITFKHNQMTVLVEFSDLEDRVDILVKPLVSNIDAKLRRERQVDLAHTILEKLLSLAETWCPGVEFERMVVRPWFAGEGLVSMLGRDVHMSVDEVKRRVQERGLGETLNWAMGEHELVTAIELLSGRDLGEWQRSEEKRAALIGNAIVELGLIPVDEGHGEFEDDQDSNIRTSDELMEKSQISEDAREFRRLLEGFQNLKTHIDRRFDRVDTAMQDFRNDLKTTLDRQKTVLHKLQALEIFSVQEKSRSVPRFLYLTKSDDASRTWVRWANLLREKMTLHFLCEAHHSLHEVHGQEGVQITDLKHWAAKIAPWVEWSFRAAFVLANIASQAVLPGLAQLLSTYPVGVGASEGATIGTTVAYLCSAVMMAGGKEGCPGQKGTTPLNLRTSTALRPIEATEGLKDVLKSIIGDMPPGEFHRKFSLRKGVVHQTANVIWICDGCRNDMGNSFVEL